MTLLRTRQPLDRTASSPAGRATILAARDLTKVWGSGDGAQTAVDRVQLDIGRGQLVAVVGPSGSGKSTLGSLLAGIDRPTAGSVVVDGERIDKLSDDKLAGWRSRRVGIVFQDFNLLPTLTAAENIELALQFQGVRRNRRTVAASALDRVGLGHKANRLPSQLSGGEQQRVGVARAIVGNPDILVADEPTGSLDQASGRAVFDLITDLARAGTTVVFITHDGELAEAADRVVAMVDGRIVDDRAGMTGALR